MNKNFLVANNATINLALKKIQENKKGVIFIREKSGKVIGMATDGDIRRALISGAKLSSQVSCCMNSDFIFESVNAKREHIIKKLDGHINVIPILDDYQRLVTVYTRDHIPMADESRSFARARAPVRISFGGGGSDKTKYFANKRGAVISTAINLYSHAALSKRDDQKIFIYSNDLDEKLSASNLEKLLDSSNKKFGLIISVIKLIKPSFGFDLYINSDFPIGSGLGGSAAVCAAILGCFNEYRRDKWTSYEMAEFAFQAERFYFSVSGGWQDQYATVFGGINFIEFDADENIIHPLRLDSSKLLELEESLLLFDSNLRHNSGKLHDSVVLSLRTEKILEQSVKVSYEMRNSLLKGELEKFARLIDVGWKLKLKSSELISNATINKIYKEAKKSGALGGKLLGAGGGGFLLFFAPQPKKFSVIKRLQSLGFKHVPFRMETGGLISWSYRENK